MYEERMWIACAPGRNVLRRSVAAVTHCEYPTHRRVLVRRCPDRDMSAAPSVVRKDLIDRYRVSPRPRGERSAAAAPHLLREVRPRQRLGRRLWANPDRVRGHELRLPGAGRPTGSKARRFT